MIEEERPVEPKRPDGAESYGESLLTANSIAHGRASGQKLPRNLHRYIVAAMALLGMGMGMFLFMWMDTLN